MVYHVYLVFGHIVELHNVSLGAFADGDDAVGVLEESRRVAVIVSDLSICSCDKETTL